MRVLDYKPYLEKYKSPVGAVTVNEYFTVYIGVSERDDVEKVYFCLTKDKENEVKYVMESMDEGYTLTMQVNSVGLYFYHFEVRQKDGGYFNVFASSDLQPTYHYGDEYVLLARGNKRHSDLIKGGLIYQIMPDRFYYEQRIKSKDFMLYRDDWTGTPTYKADENGKVHNLDMFGGNLAGIKAKLDYLCSLGVTCIYLNPIFSASSNHKYDTADYLSVDSDFGDEKDLKELIDEAKKRGISIMLDGVFSHTGDDSIYFNRYGRFDSLGAYQSKDSPYYKWYKFDSFPDKYKCWWGVLILPETDESEPSFDRFINGEGGVIEKYTSLGVSAWRLDVADELPDDFIARLSERAKSVYDNALVLGEVWEDATTKTAYGERRKYFWGNELDSVTNYPLKNAIIDYARGGDAKALCGVVVGIIDRYPSDVVCSLMNMLSTHDTVRPLNSLSFDSLPQSKDERAEKKISDREDAKKRLYLCALLQYTLPGVPCVFYGDEAGLEGYEDPFNRRCYPWGNEDGEILSYYKTLGNMRKKYKDVFADGQFNPVFADGGVFHFTRKKGNKTIHVITNAKDKEVNVTAFDLLTKREVKKVGKYGVLVYVENKNS